MCRSRMRVASRLFATACHGAQFAVDSSLVSPAIRDGSSHDGADNQPGWAVRNAAMRKRRQTYPELGFGACEILHGELAGYDVL